MVAKRWAAMPIVLLAIGSVCGWASTAEPTPPDVGQGDDSLPEFGPGESYHPVVDPTNFTAEVDNPLFPLPPGRTLVYSGTKDGKPALNVFAVTSKTALIEGVTTRVVEDRLFLDGLLEERI